MSAGSDHGTFVLFKVPSMTYKSILQFREKHPQTVKPPPPNVVVPTICSCYGMEYQVVEESALVG
jgi:hypothetical protein